MVMRIGEFGMPLQRCTSPLTLSAFNSLPIFGRNGHSHVESPHGLIRRSPLTHAKQVSEDAPIMSKFPQILPVLVVIAGHNIAHGRLVSKAAQRNESIASILGPLVSANSDNQAH